MLLPDVFLNSYLQQIRTGDRTRRPPPLQPPLHASAGRNRRHHLHRRNPLIELNLVRVFAASRTLRIIGNVKLQCASSPPTTHRKP
jgi:hypothetical protein